MHTRTYASVLSRLQRLSGRELAAVAAAAGVGRSTVYRLRGGSPSTTVNVRDTTIARLERALARHQAP